MENNAKKELEKRIAKAGSQKAFADELAISASYLNDILQGKRSLTPAVLSKLGYVRVSVDVPGNKELEVRKAIEKTLRRQSPTLNDIPAHVIGKKEAAR